MRIKSILFYFIIIFYIPIASAGLYDDIKKLPYDVLKDNFPAISNLDKGSEIKWFHVLNVEENASKKEIKSAYQKLALKFHPDKNEKDYASDIMGCLTSANNKKTDNTSSITADDNNLSFQSILWKLLPKKMIAHTILLPTIIYSLVKGVQSKYAQSQIKKIEEKMPDLYSSVKFISKPINEVAKAGYQSGKLAINVCKIGSGVLLIIFSLPTGLISIPYIVFNKDNSYLVGDDEFEANFIKYTKQPDGSYIGHYPFVNAETFQINAEELKNTMKWQYTFCQRVGITYMICSISFLTSGITTIKNGAHGIKSLFTKKIKTMKSIH